MPAWPPRRGDYGAAARHFEAAHRYADVPGRGRELCDLVRFEAEMLRRRAAEGDLERADALLRQGLEKAEAFDLPWYVDRIKAQLAATG